VIVQVKWKEYEKMAFSTNISLYAPLIRLRHMSLNKFVLIDLFISETIQDTNIFTMQHEYELVCDLSKGAIFDNL